MQRRAPKTMDTRPSRRRKLSIAVAACVIGGGLLPVLAATGQTAEANLLTANQQTFEASPTGWTDGAVTRSSRSTQYAAEGKYSLKVVADGPKFDETKAVHVTTLGGTAGARIAVGTSYSVRVQVRPWRTATTQVACHLDWFAADGVSLGAGPRSWQAEAAERWTTVSCAGVAPASAAFAAVRVEFASVRRGDVHYVDEAWLIAGSTGDGRPPDAATTTLAAPTATTAPITAPATTVATPTSAAPVPAPSTVLATTVATTTTIPPVPTTAPVAPVPISAPATATTTTTLPGTTVPATTVATTTTLAPATVPATVPAFDADHEQFIRSFSTALHDGGPLTQIPDYYDWSARGRPGVWPPFLAYGVRYWHPWGHVFIGRGTSQENVRLEVSNPAVFFLVSGVWQRVERDWGTMAGSWYANGFNSVDAPKSIVYDAARKVNSVDLTPLADGARFWHWWWAGGWPRQPLQGDDPICVVTWQRIVGPEAATAQITSGVAGDVYVNADDVRPKNDAAFGIPSHRFVTPQFRPHGYCTLSEAQYRANPIPLASTKP